MTRAFVFSPKTVFGKHIQCLSLFQWHNRNLNCRMQGSKETIRLPHFCSHHIISYISLEYQRRNQQQGAAHNFFSSDKKKESFWTLRFYVHKNTDGNSSCLKWNLITFSTSCLLELQLTKAPFSLTFRFNGGLLLQSKHHLQRSNDYLTWWNK